MTVQLLIYNLEVFPDDAVVVLVPDSVQDEAFKFDADSHTVQVRIGSLTP